MHIYDATSYLLLQNYNLFCISFFFRRNFLGIRLDIRKISDIQLEEIVFLDIHSDTGYPILHSVRISDIWYPVILRSSASL